MSSQRPRFVHLVAPFSAMLLAAGLGVLMLLLVAELAGIEMRPDGMGFREIALGIWGTGSSFLIVAVIFLSASRGRFREESRLETADPIDIIVVSVGMISSAMVLSDVIALSGLSNEGALGEITRAMRAFTPSERWLMAPLTAVLAPVAEELFFRGFVLRRFERFGGTRFAIFGSSVLFGLAHFDPVHSTAAVVMGLFLGFAAVRAGSIVPTIAAHALNNLVATLLPSWPQSALGVGVSGLVGAIVFIPTVVLLMRRHPAAASPPPVWYATEVGEPQAKWQQLADRMREISDLDHVLGLLSWDEQTTAPRAARGPRGEQSATVEAIRHQRLVDPALGELLDELVSSESDPAKHRAAELLLKRHRRAVRVPERLVKELAEARSVATAAWEQARQDDDFSAFEPHLVRMFELTRTKAESLADGGPLYDALLDEYEPEMTTRVVEPLLASLREPLVSLVSAVREKGTPPNKHLLDGAVFDVDKQWQLTLRLLGELGFDMDRGRQDRSVHPMTETCGYDDVRLTTRLDERNLLDAVLSSVHEAGHGMYEQGLPKAYRKTPIAQAASLGLHESQSRLWEVHVGRSHAFWEHYLPVLRGMFGETLDAVDADAFYRIINIVEPGPIRVDADALTYDLHILVRFELELALLSGDLPIADLPGAWRDKMESYLGVRPDSDRRGCLQDVHWSVGAIGYFPTYTIGNLYAAQLMDAFEAAHPEFWSEARQGRFSTLLTWLRTNVHERGSLVPADTIVSDATGRGLSIQPFLARMKRRYEEAYQI